MYNTSLLKPTKCQNHQLQPHLPVWTTPQFLFSFSNRNNNYLGAKALFILLLINACIAISIEVVMD